MNRRHVLIGAMAAIILVLAVALAYVIGRQSSPPGEAPVTANASPGATPADAAPPAPGEGGAPAPPAAYADAALSQWIVGGWAEVSTNCETDTGVYYDARGRYGAAGEEGRWRIEDGRLVVTVTHEAVGDPLAGEMRALPSPRSQRMSLTREGGDRMTLVIDGQLIPMMRCPEAQHSFAT